MTVGGRVFLGGIVVSAAGVGLLFARHQFPAPVPRLMTNPNAGLLAAGLVIVALGCLVYTAEPAVNRKAAQQVPYGTARTSLAMFVTALILTTLLSLPLLLLPGQAAAGRAANAALQPWILVYLVIASELPIAFVVWLRLVQPGCLSWHELGLRGGPAVELALKGLVGGVALFLAAGLVSAGLNAVGVQQNQFERFAGVEHAPLPAFLAAVLAGAALAPFCEELFFRGYVFQTFGRRHGLVLGYAYSAALFAVVHTNFAAAVPIFVLGLMLAYIFQSSRSLWPGMIAHGVNNAIAFVLLYQGFTG